jgi:hypothetical protein
VVSALFVWLSLEGRDGIDDDDDVVTDGGNM